MTKYQRLFSKMQAVKVKYSIAEVNNFDKEVEIEKKPTFKEKRKAKSIETKKSQRAYKNLVWKLTNEQPIHLLPNFELRALKGYHLDHKISIWYGWKNGIPADQIACIKNLRFIPFDENEKKGIKVFVDACNKHIIEC